MNERKVAAILASSTVSIIKLVDAVIEEAHILGASDIHIDPNRDGLRIRLRIDGVLVDTYQLPKNIHLEVISRVKVLAGMRTDEHKLTQDGRFRLVYPNGEVLDIRVSIAPTYYGENVVLRLLSDKASNLSLEMLGYSIADRDKITTAMRRPYGMILSTGPTGSGKTTTLYTIIKMLNSPQISILTIEDPIEYAIDQIEQIQVNVVAGLTFANGLRSILRQDPNVIMVGEIRDAETASIAVNTALTGHLLLSTLHTNDSATTLPRLLDMGIDPYLVASTINIAIGQRLVRKLCPVCTEEIVVTDAMRQTLATVPLQFPVRKGDVFYRGKGCDSCTHSGYTGRLCISEVLVADQAIRDAIMRKASSAELKALAIKGGMTTMLEDGFEKARAGQTTIEEVLRVVYE
jgi:type IV pilus assembly protein PilB